MSNIKKILIVGAGIGGQSAAIGLKKAGFEVAIQDSIYVDTLQPLTVIKQIPDADELHRPR